MTVQLPADLANGEHTKQYCTGESVSRADQEESSVGEAVDDIAAYCHGG